MSPRIAVDLPEPVAPIAATFLVASWRLRGTPASVTPPVSRAHNRPPLAPVNGRSLVPLRCLILRGHAARRAAIAPPRKPNVAGITTASGQLSARKLP